MLMSLLFVLVEKTLPLYLLVAVGYLIAKRTPLSRRALSQVLIYILLPIVVFLGVLQVNLSIQIVSMPLAIWLVGCVLAVASYLISKEWWPGSVRHLFGFMAGDANAAYFGIPVVAALLGEQYVGLAVVAALGFPLYESTVGFYFIARGKHTVMSSLKHLLTLPILYAFLLGVLANAHGITLHASGETLLNISRYAMTILGMATVGMALATANLKAIDQKLVTASFVVKFLVWPAIVACLIGVDSIWLHLLSPGAHAVMLIMSVVPLPANAVVFASMFNVQANKAAVTVFLSILFALVYVPVALVLLRLA